MAESDAVVMFKGAKALEHYLAETMARDPKVLDAPCKSGILGPGDEWWFALAASDLPDPGPAFEGSARLVKGEIDTRSKRLSIRGRGRPGQEAIPIPDAASYETVLEAVPLRAWSVREQGDVESVVVIPGPELAAPVATLASLGRDLGAVLVSDVQDGSGRVLVDLGKGSWSVVEDLLAWDRTNGGEPTLAYRRLPGRPRVLVAWGLVHPFESALKEPKAKGSVLVVEADGRHVVLRLGPSESAGARAERAVAAVRLDVPRVGAGDDVEAFPTVMRLEARHDLRDPEVWVVPAGMASELEALLARTPEEELKNLAFAEVDGPHGRCLVVRERIAARRAARLLPLSGKTYAPEPGLGGLFLPTDARLSPRLAPSVVAKAFSIVPGEVTLLERGPDGEVSTLKIDESQFQPVEDFAEFSSGHEPRKSRLAMDQSPYAVRPFEDDLVIEAPRPARKLKREAPEVEDDEHGHEEAPRKAVKKSAEETRRKEEPEPEAAPSPSVKGAKKKKEDADGPGSELEMLELQRTLATQPDDALAWFKLAAILFEKGDEEEGIRALENAAWSGDDEVAHSAKGALAARHRRGGSEVAALWDAISSFVSSAPTLSRQALRTKTAEAYELLRSRQEQLRKKTRWLLWEELAGVAGDEVEAERQREDILAELVLRGVEDREIPPFVRQRLLEQYSSTTVAKGGKPTEALEFLATAERFASSAGTPAYIAASTAHVAWAYAELGSVDKARELVKVAERSLERAAEERQGGLLNSRTTAFARVGSVLERVDGPGAGREHVRRGLDVATETTAQAGRQPTAIEVRKALVRWFRILAAAGQSQEVVKSASAGLDRASKLPDNAQATFLDEASEALLSLGQADRAKEMARRIIAKPDVSLVYHEHAAKALDVLEEGRVKHADAAALLALARRRSSEIDEFATELLHVALRVEKDPWKAAEKLAAEIEKERPYGAMIVRLSGLRCLAEIKDRERGAKLLAETIEAAKAHRGDGGGLERMRILVRLIYLVPALAPRERGVAILRGVKDWARQDGSLYTRNEILAASVLSASKLGMPAETVRLLEEVVDQVLQLVEKPEGNRQVAYLFEALDAAATGAAEIGEPERGLTLVGRVAGAATAAISRYQRTQEKGERNVVDGVGRFFYYQALIRCGAAAIALGDRDAAQRYFEQALERVKDTSGIDRSDLLNRAAAASNQLDGSARYALAARILELARGCLDGTEHTRQFVVDLAERISSDVVRGESAFAAALARWKGNEESRIRDRLSARVAVAAT